MAVTLTLLRMDLFWAAQGWGGGKEVVTQKNLSYISCNDETWHSYSYLKKIQKTYKSRDTPLEFY